MRPAYFLGRAIHFGHPNPKGVGPYFSRIEKPPLRSSTVSFRRLFPGLLTVFSNYRGLREVLFQFLFVIFIAGK